MGESRSQSLGLETLISCSNVADFPGSIRCDVVAPLPAGWPSGPIRVVLMMTSAAAPDLLTTVLATLMVAESAAIWMASGSCVAG